MAKFLSARSYRHGGLGAALALSYLGLVALLLVPAAAEAALPGPADDSFFFGFAMLATLPLSIAVMLGYSGIATAQGFRSATKTALGGSSQPSPSAPWSTPG